MSLYQTYKSGPFRGTKVQYSDGLVGVTIWRPETGGPEVSGPCLDVLGEELEDFGALVGLLDDAAPDLVAEHPISDEALEAALSGSEPEPEE